MKRLLPFILMIALSACRTTVPSQAITNNAVNELNGVKESIKHIQATTTPECKTEALTANLRAIMTQVDGVSGQIKNIELACKTEKNVLETEKQVREVIIISLLLGIVAYVFLRLKKWAI